MNANKQKIFRTNPPGNRISGSSFIKSSEESYGVGFLLELSKAKVESLRRTNNCSWERI